MSPAGTGEDSALGFPHTWVTAVLTPDHSSALEHWLLGRGKEKGRENRRKGAGRLGFICRQLGNTHRGLQVTRVAPGSVLAKEQGRSDVLSEVFFFSSCSPKRAQIRTWQHSISPSAEVSPRKYVVWAGLGHGVSLSTTCTVLGAGWQLLEVGDNRRRDTF